MKVNNQGNQLGIGIIGLLLGVMLGVGGLILGNRQRPVPLEILPAPPTPTAVPTATPGPIQVYINGAVRYPDVYELPPNAIVRDVVNAAGGFATDAAADFINLAQPLQGGMQLYVPRLGEETAVTNPIIPAVRSGAINILSAESDNSGTQLININSATQAELETLPGIGPSTAQNIIAHREEHGLFNTIEDIMNVAGIGPAKFGAIEALISVDGR